MGAGAQLLPFLPPRCCCQAAARKRSSACPHLKRGEEPSQTAQAEMPFCQYVSRPLMGSFRAAAPVAMMTASASTTRESVSRRKGEPCGAGRREWGGWRQGGDVGGSAHIARGQGDSSPGSRNASFPLFKQPAPTRAPPPLKTHVLQVQLGNRLGEQARAVRLALRSEAVAQVAPQDGLGEAGEVFDVPVWRGRGGEQAGE